MDRVECVVVGAGVVGLAVARVLALAGRKVLLVEAATSIGTGISSRNSEVIHAGLFTRMARSGRACVCRAGRCCMTTVRSAAWVIGAAANSSWSPGQRRRRTSTHSGQGQPQPRDWPAAAECCPSSAVRPCAARPLCCRPAPVLWTATR